MFVIVMIILILFPEGAQTGAKEGLRFAFENVIVAILPFAFLSSAIIYSGTAKRVGDALAPLFKRLKLHPYGATALITGLLGGYPTGCKTACEMYSEGLIDKSECEKIIAYTNNGGLIFALNICGEQLFGDRGAGLVVFSASALSALVTGLLFARENGEISEAETKKLPFMAAVGRSVASCGNVIINIASSFIVFYAIAGALNLSKVPFIEGIFEMTKGIGFAKKAGSLPLTSFFFSLGGLGVFAQSAAICSGYDIKLTRYAYCKAFQAFLAFLITYIIVNRPFIGKEIVAFSALAVIGAIFAVKAIKKLYAKA